MRAVIYCRVSTKDQVENLSLSSQKQRCEEYCQRHGWDVAACFIEKGESAKTTQRTELGKLRAYCKENKGRVDFVIVHSVSRFARKGYDRFSLKMELMRLGISLRSVTEPIDESPEGQFMEGVLAACAAVP